MKILQMKCKIIKFNLRGIIKMAMINKIQNNNKQYPYNKNLLFNIYRVFINVIFQ